jgi:hypothetical protein
VHAAELLVCNFNKRVRRIYFSHLLAFASLECVTPVKTASLLRNSETHLRLVIRDAPSLHLPPSLLVTQQIAYLSEVKSGNCEKHVN